MMKKLFIALILLGSHSGHCQSCDSLKKMPVDTNSLALLDTLFAYQHCSQIDLFDIEFGTTFLSQFYYETKRNGGKYGDLFDRYILFKKTDYYKEYRQGNLVHFEFKHLTIEKSTWEKAKRKLKNQGESNKRLKEYQKFLQANPDFDEHGKAWSEFIHQ